MEIREIRVFLVLSDELHFGRAAERLYVTPTRVSQIVRTMETQIGGQLFERTSRQVRLTPLGERLREGLRPVYDELNRVLDEVRDVAGGVTGELRIGLYSQLVGGRWIAEIIRLFEERHPASHVTIKAPSVVVGLEELRHGSLDVIASWLPLEEPDMVIGPLLTSEARVLTVRLGHPLAERGHANVEDLADWAVVDRTGLPEVTRDVLIPRTTPGGRLIERRQRVDTAVETLALVARGAVVHPTVASAADYMQFPGVTYVPLLDLPPLHSALVWREAAETTGVRAFAQVARDVVLASG